VATLNQRSTGFPITDEIIWLQAQLEPSGDVTFNMRSFDEIATDWPN
jgi:hypothetical protein